MRKLLLALLTLASVLLLASCSGGKPEDFITFKTVNNG